MIVRLFITQIVISVAYIITLLWVAYAMNNVMTVQTTNSDVIMRMFTSLNHYIGNIDDTTKEVSEQQEKIVEEVKEAGNKVEKAAASATKAAKAADSASANTKQTKSTVTAVEKKVDKFIDKDDPKEKDGKSPRRSFFGK